MKRKFTTKLCIIALSIILSICTTGCNKEKKGEQQDPLSVENEENNILTAEEYKNKLNEIYTSIQTETETAKTNINSSDLKTSNDARKALSEKLKPIYEQLTSLNAPEEFKEAQEKIKTGANAAIEALDLSIKMINLGTDVTTEQQAELTAQMNTLTETMKELNVGISMIPQ